jgi:hypothetical protein
VGNFDRLQTIVSDTGDAYVYLENKGAQLFHPLGACSLAMLHTGNEENHFVFFAF